VTAPAGDVPALLRRYGLILILVGGVVLVWGWGFEKQEWARAVGWIFAGIGFATQMIYDIDRKKARRKAAEPPEDV
jgi:hypothetical protein